MEISNAIDAQKLCLVLVTNMCCLQGQEIFRKFVC